MIVEAYDLRPSDLDTFFSWSRHLASGSCSSGPRETKDDIYVEASIRAETPHRMLYSMNVCTPGSCRSIHFQYTSYASRGHPGIAIDQLAPVQPAFPPLWTPHMQTCQDSYEHTFSIITDTPMADDLGIQCT